MLYSSLCARIQSQAAMTSLTRPLPLSSRTSSETMFARGSAPVYDEPPFAAMLATSVPWPRPSPVEFVPAETKFTWVRSLEPNSLRLWTPESTTAIVG